MSKESRDTEVNRAYQDGRRGMIIELLGVLARELGNDPRAEVARLKIERLEAVSRLREICAEFGDNDWPDNLNLADVIEKHLGRHLGE